MIKIAALKKSYDKDVILENINLNIKKGDIYGLVGASGAGKSTLLRCINGLVDYDSGSLVVDGVDLKKLNNEELMEFRKNIGMVFQQFSLLERLTVYENVDLPMKCCKYSKEDRQKKVNELLDLVGLLDKKDSRPGELSGGQKQRVAIARALTLDPKILLFDEATSALDPNTANSILHLVRKINEEFGLTVIVVAHQMEVVRKVCNKMALLKDGELIADGKVTDIFMNEPKELRELLGKDSKEVLPADGVNIKIVIKNPEDKYIISDITRDTNIRCKIVWGGMDKYRDEVNGSFIINLALEDMTILKKYLEDKGIQFDEAI
ncbi:methionine ABC transporter ATP-binding protein [Metaclostridioides mangenotii]|uniref:D-methionine transport system ATP-binding protein n=1 Tax=Metaclostridioides mangenotii TaxID=1540 RepID=A0ABS4EB53_9FIRM|nr:methionine ABC transporter ATP-binding protein [Clostridioides mangenotii]MBP1855161.1 D-methionine transport system ATP-binding protein [Clostridioides mangenotii]